MKISTLLKPLLMGALLTGPLWAETESPPIGVDPLELDETEYSYGTVKEMAPDKMVVSEYDEETGLSSDVSYAIDPKALLEDVGTLGEIAVGDSVDVEYVIQDGNKIAKVISVERLLPGEEADAAGLAY